MEDYVTYVQVIPSALLSDPFHEHRAFNFAFFH